MRTVSATRASPNTARRWPGLPGQAGAVWLDLGAATAAAVTATGAEHAKSLYLWHGDKHDDAHLQQAGALRFARAFARLVLQSTDPRLDVLKAAFEEE